MSHKNLKILAVVFIVLLGIASYPLFREEVENVIKPGPKNVTLFNEVLDVGEVSMINISRGADRLEFRRHADGWKVNDKNADELEVEKLINEFNDMTVGDIVSRNPENHDSFGVSEQTGVSLKINSQNKDFSVIIGSYASSGAFYVRKEGSDDVYVAKSILKQNLSVTPLQWRDKTIADLNTEDITKIAYEGKRNFSLEKSGDFWEYKWSWRTEEIAPEDVEKFKNLFSPMTTSSFADEEETEIFDKSRNKNNIKVYKGEDVLLELLVLEKEAEDEEADNYLHIKNITEESDVYEVGMYVIQGITEYLDK